MTKRSLLLVDGDAKSLRVLEVSLRKAGFTVSTAASGKEALELLTHLSPDLVISDTDMPDMDGYEFCREFKSKPQWKDVPFIFLTHKTQIADKIRGLELGVDDYLTKPIYIKEIITRVRILLQKHERTKFAEKQDNNTRFTGQLSDMGVIDLIQTIEVSRKTGVIHFHADEKRQATMFFKEGRVIDAEAGHLQGEDAVYRLLTWNDGKFEALFRPVRRRAVIEISSQSLLMEGMRRLDEWGRLQEQLPPLQGKFQVVYDELWDRLAEMPDDINQILRLFDTRRTLQEVIDGSLIGDLETVEVISKLYFEGIIVEVAPEPNSGSDPVEDLVVQAQAAFASKAARKRQREQVAAVEHELVEATERDAIGPIGLAQGAAKTPEAIAAKTLEPNEESLSGLLEQAITDATLLTTAAGKRKEIEQRPTAKGQAVAPLPSPTETDSEATEASTAVPVARETRPKTQPMGKVTPKTEMDEAAREADELAASVTAPIADAADLARLADEEASSVTIPVEDIVALARAADEKAVNLAKEAESSKSVRGQAHTVDAIPIEVIDDERGSLSSPANNTDSPATSKVSSQKGKEYEAGLEDLGEDVDLDDEMASVVASRVATSDFSSSASGTTSSGTVSKDENPAVNVLPASRRTRRRPDLTAEIYADELDFDDEKSSTPVLGYLLVAAAAGLILVVAIKGLGGGDDRGAGTEPLTRNDASVVLAAHVSDAAAPPPSTIADARQAPPTTPLVDAAPALPPDARRAVVRAPRPDARSSSPQPPATTNDPPSPADQIKALQKAARKASRSGDRLGAIAILDEALEIRRSSTTLYLKADALLSLGDSVAAVVLAKELARIAPKRAQGFRILGSASYETKDYAGARAAFTRYLELAPGANDAAGVRTLLDSL